MKSVYSSKLLLITVFVFSLFFLVHSPTHVQAAPGPGESACTCEVTPGGSGLCEGSGCYPAVRTTVCGSNLDICELAQKRYACENALLFISYYQLDPDFIGSPGKYLCPYNDGNFTTDKALAEKGSWSEVFRRCYCSTGDVIQQVLNIAVYSISIIALFLLVIGGVKYMTAQNNPDKITEAKEMLIAAILGMILVLFSVTLLRLLNAQLNPDWGIDLLNIP